MLRHKHKKRILQHPERSSDINIHKASCSTLTIDHINIHLAQMLKHMYIQYETLNTAIIIDVIKKLSFPSSDTWILHLSISRLYIYILRDKIPVSYILSTKQQYRLIAAKLSSLNRDSTKNFHFPAQCACFFIEY